MSHDRECYFSVNLDGRYNKKLHTVEAGTFLTRSHFRSGCVTLLRVIDSHRGELVSGFFSAKMFQLGLMNYWIIAYVHCCSF